MTDKDQPYRPDTISNKPSIEVYLKPDYAQPYLAASLHRTRRRAGNLVGDLVDAVRQSDLDPVRLRQLADGIQFETELARELSFAMADCARGSDF